jgi:type IV pilus assembly protein PilO
MATPSVAAGFSLAKLPLAGKIGLGAFLVLLVGLGYWVVFYTEVSAKIDNANRQTSELKQQLAQVELSRSSYLVDRDELVMRQQRQRELNKILPADAEAAAFLSSLQQVSNVSGIDLKAWQPMDEQQQAYFAVVPMKLEITGRFHQIAKFVYEVGKLDRIINVANIELSEPVVVGDDILLKAKCLATTFHTLKPKAAPTGQPGAPAAPGAPGAPAPAPAPNAGGAKP